MIPADRDGAWRVAHGMSGVPPPDPVPKPDQARTLAHLSQTVLTALGHIARHSVMARKAPNRESLTFNLEHMNRHVAEALEHHRKLISTLSAYHPEVGDEIAVMQLIADPASTAPIPQRSGKPADYDAGQDRGPRPA